MARLPYIFVRKGSPSAEAQREALAAAGLTDDELAEAWADAVERKPRAGQAIRPNRDLMLGALREGDEVWVMRPAILAETEDEALRFLAEIAKDKATLRIVSTGRSYSHEACDEMLTLAADVIADLRKQQTDNARKAPRRPRVSTFPAEKWELARRLWPDERETARSIEKATGIGFRTLYRELGARGTPIFGKIPQRKHRRRK
jgi:hypothetical protein